LQSHTNILLVAQDLLCETAGRRVLGVFEARAQLSSPFSLPIAAARQ